MGAKRHGVADVLEGERVIGHAGNASEVDAAAARDDHVVVGQAAGVAVVRFILDGVRGDVHVADGFGPALHAAQHLAQRRSDGVRIDRCAGDLRQQRMEHHVVFAVEEDDLPRRARKPAAHGPRALHASESAANDHDSPYVRAHVAGRSRRTVPVRPAAILGFFRRKRSVFEGAGRSPW